MSFWYPFLNFLQPGILFPDLAVFKPLLLASAIGLVLGVRYQSSFSRKTAFSNPIFISLIVFIAVQVVSVYYGGVALMWEEFLFWVVYPIFVIIAVILIPNIASLKKFVWGMIVGGAFVVCYGIYAFFAQIGEAVEGRAGAYGMYENSNDYSFIIILLLPFVFVYWQHSTGWFRRLFLGVAVVACVGGIFLSLSRGGVLALMLEGLLLILFGMRDPRRFWLIPVLAIVAAIAIPYQYRARAANDGESYTAEHSQEGRYELWRSGLLMLKVHPILGVGSRRFTDNNPYYGDVSDGNLGKVAHNTYIEILAGSGLSGFAAFALMCFGMLRVLWQRTPLCDDIWLNAIKRAALISLCAILFRAYFGSKQADWSFYVLCAISIACHMLQHSAAHAIAQIKKTQLP